jgi:hypothetical protein
MIHFCLGDGWFCWLLNGAFFDKKVVRFFARAKHAGVSRQNRWLAMNELNKQLAALELVDALMHSKRMSPRAAELVMEFKKLLCETMRWSCNGSKQIRTQQITAFFGAKPLVVAKLWDLLVMEKAGPWPTGIDEKHLLWALHLAKVHASKLVFILECWLPWQENTLKVGMAVSTINCRLLSPTLCRVSTTSPWITAEPF